MNDPSQTLHLLRYQPRYLESLLTLHRSAISRMTLGMSREEDEADLMAIEQLYLLSGGEFLMGLIGDNLVAMGGFQRLSDEVAELRRMRIASDLQGRGYGSQLLQELERLAQQSGIRSLKLETAIQRPLTLEFYRRHGYTETGRSFYGAVETMRFSKSLASDGIHV